MSNPHRTASPRALTAMRAAVAELAERRGVSTREVYDELGAYEDTIGGPRLRVLTAPLVAAMTTRARDELAALPAPTDEQN